ncbi:MAG TPA: metal ABC transporter permease [Candidatus Eisenbacteria bacterium]|nr:metal ABC transporter permease [Candidatus Eisenbacteria bacterium]
MPASALVLSIAMAVAAGLVGSFAVMRRMTLAADAISHVALPGIGLALAFGVHPALGAAAALGLGAVLIWTLESRTRIATETLIGVVFSTALAVGSILASGDELIDALLGSPGALTQGELAIGLAGAIAVVVFVLVARHRLLVALVSPDIARTAGVDVRRLDLIYLFAFALTVALGLRYLGVLLMGSLIIIPAATAKYLARSLRGMLTTAALVAVFATVAGDALATRFDRPTGPLIVMAAAGVFAVSLIARRAP